MPEREVAALVACDHDASYGNGDGTRTCILAGCGVTFTPDAAAPLAYKTDCYRCDGDGRWWSCTLDGECDTEDCARDCDCDTEPAWTYEQFYDMEPRPQARRSPEAGS